MRGHAIQETLACKKKHWWFTNYYSVSCLDFSVCRAIFLYFRYVSISIPRKCLGYLDTDTCDINGKKLKKREIIKTGKRNKNNHALR